MGWLLTGRFRLRVKSWLPRVEENGQDAGGAGPRRFAPSLLMPSQGRRAQQLAGGGRGRWPLGGGPPEECFRNVFLVRSRPRFPISDETGQGPKWRKDAPMRGRAKSPLPGGTRVQIGCGSGPASKPHHALSRACHPQPPYSEYANEFKPIFNNQLIHIAKLDFSWQKMKKYANLKR